MAAPRLDTLPSELLFRVFSHLDAKDVLNAGCCKRLRQFSLDSVIWRHLCATFNHWTQEAEDTTWMARFKRRFRLERRVDDMVDRLIQGPNPVFLNNLVHNSYLHFENDWAVKDRLRLHFNTPDIAPDVLARRYWASAVMVAMNRRYALDTWSQLTRSPVDLEQALTSIDMFVREDGLVDFMTISDKITDLANEFKRKFNLQWNRGGLSTRDLALKLAQFLVIDKGFQSNSEGSAYYKPACSLLSLSLENPGFYGMPLIYACLYSFAASRIRGFEAKPLALPGHVFVIIAAPKDEDLDGNVKSLDSSPQTMYLDLWRSQDFEVPEQHLRLLLTSAQIPASDHDENLKRPTSTLEIMRRVRRNISAGYEMLFMQAQPLAFEYNGWPLELGYASSCLTAFIMEQEGGILALANSRVPYLTLSAQCARQPWDLALLQKYIPPGVGDHILKALHNRIIQGFVHRETKLRTPAIDEKVAYKIGTLFKHRRYQYVGFIIGWSKTCSMDPQWQATMGVHNLEHGASQSFYDIICWDPSNNETSSRHVAQENITPLSDLDSVPQSLMMLAGRYFLRWDDVEHIFVNNNKQEYPDD